MEIVLKANFLRGSLFFTSLPGTCEIVTKYAGFKVFLEKEPGIPLCVILSSRSGQLSGMRLYGSVFQIMPVHQDNQ